MEIRIYIDDVDYSDRAIHERTRLETQMDGGVSTASFTLYFENALGDYYGAAIYGHSRYGSGTISGIGRASVRIEEADASPANIIFQGEVARITKSTQRVNLDFWTIEAIGFEYKLDEVVVSATYANQTDRAIIQAAFASLPEIAVDSSTIDQIQSGITLTVESWSLRELLTRLATLTAARWWLSPSRVLYYALATSATPPDAPFAIDIEFPDEATTFPATLAEPQEDYSKLANRVTAIGATLTSGSRATYIAEDAASQALYGIRSRTLPIDEDLTTNALCQLRAEAEVLTYKDVLREGSFTVRRDGLVAGMKIAIDATAYNVHGEFLIRRLSMSWETKYATVYAIDFGRYDKRQDAIIRRLQQEQARNAKQPTSVSITNIKAPGTPGSNTFLSGTGWTTVPGSGGGGAPVIGDADVVFRADLQWVIDSERFAGTRVIETIDTGSASQSILAMYAPEKFFGIIAHFVGLPLTGGGTAGDCVWVVLDSENSGLDGLIFPAARVGSVYNNYWRLSCFLQDLHGNGPLTSDIYRIGITDELDTIDPQNFIGMLLDARVDEEVWKLVVTVDGVTSFEDVAARPLSIAAYTIWRDGDGVHCRIERLDGTTSEATITAALPTFGYAEGEYAAYAGLMVGNAKGHSLGDAPELVHSALEFQMQLRELD